MHAEYIESYSISDWWNLSVELSGSSLEESLVGGRITVKTSGSERTEKAPAALQVPAA